MSTARRLMGMTVGLAAVLSLIGCADPKDQQIEALQQEKEGLQQENANLRGRLQTAMSERDEARARALDLAEQLRNLQSGLSRTNRPAPGFTRSGVYDWKEVSEDILFDSGKAELKPTARATIQQLANDIKNSYADRNIWVIGNTDTDPIKHSKWKDNLELSVQRGAAVARELYALGVDKVHVIAGGQGEFNPRATNATEQGKMLNRRVQIVAAPPLQESGGAPSSPGAGAERESQLAPHDAYETAQAGDAASD